MISPPFVLCVMQLVIAILMVLIALSIRRVRRYQTQVLAQLRQLQQLSRLDRETLAYLQEQDQTITHHVNEGMRRLERELHLHAGSNLLHPGAPPDVT